MKDRYDDNLGKDARMANKRESRMESNLTQIMSLLNVIRWKCEGKAGKDPRMNAEMMDFCSYMSNNGEHAQEFGRELTKGLDKEAFPVK